MDKLSEKSSFNEIPLDMLDSISGGTLPDGWQNKADQMASAIRKAYPYATYEQVCKALRDYIPDPDDYAVVCEYIKKFF